MITLRPYQQRAQSMVDASFGRGARSVIACLPVGAGKTISFASYATQAILRSERVVWVAHRRELITQAAEAFRRLGYTNFAVVQGVPKGDAAFKVPLVLCSIQKVMRTESRLNDPTLVVVDECHLAPSTRYMESLMRWQGQARFVGLSATPDREGLGKLFEEIVHPVHDSELVEAGVLVPAQMEGVSERTRVEWDDAGSPSWQPIVLYKEHCILPERHRKLLTFCNTRKQNAIMLRELGAAGATVAEVYGDMPGKQRDKVLRDHQEGRITNVVNCGVLTAGYDDTSIEGLLLMAPCLKRTTYVQIGGRARRAHTYPWGPKTHAIIIDMTGAYTEHGRPDTDMWYPLEEGRKHLDCPQCGAELLRGDWLLRKDKNCEACAGKDGSYRHCPKCGWHFAIPEKEKGEGLTAKERQEFPPAMIVLIDAIVSRIPGMARAERGIQKALENPVSRQQALDWQQKNYDRDDVVVMKATYYALISYRRKLNELRKKKGQPSYKFGWCMKTFEGWYGAPPSRDWRDYTPEPDERR
jgi:superfamily II DNA or RNA helicase